MEQRAVPGGFENELLLSCLLEVPDGNSDKNSTHCRKFGNLVWIETGNKMIVKACRFSYVTSTSLAILYVSSSSQFIVVHQGLGAELLRRIRTN